MIKKAMVIGFKICLLLYLILVVFPWVSPYAAWGYSFFVVGTFTVISESRDWDKG